MTDARFKQLVDLYLDHEISTRDLLQLRRELQSNERKAEFSRLRRVYEAEKKALQMICGGPDRQAHRCSLSQRAAKAINDARLGFEERRKGLVLLSQFSVATIAIALSVGFIYRDSVESLEVPADPIDGLAGQQPIQVPQLLQEQLRNNQGPPRLLVDRDGRAIALISSPRHGEFSVQPVRMVNEGNLLRLSEALEAAKPTLPKPSELMEAREFEIPVRNELPGTSAPIVLVDDEPGAGAVIGFAY